MDEELKAKQSEGGVVASSGDTDIDQLLRARTEIDAALRRHKAQFTVLFTDIVGSTSFFERYGDTAGLLMLERHNDLVMPAIQEGGGTVVKTIGDAVMAVFSSPGAAVETAIAIQKRLDTYNEERPQAERIYTRVGLNFGRGYVKAKDVFGDVVNVAARVVKACAAAQILLGSAVYEALKDQPGIQCRKLEAAVFHGKSTEEEIYEVLWTTPERYERLRQQLDAKAGSAGRSVVGRYEILDNLGRGAMGEVYKAYDPAVGRIVALKTVRLTATGEEREELVRRLRQEALAAGRLEHPNIVTIYDAGKAEGLFYLTMQLVKGRTLAELMGQRVLLPVKQVLLVLDQVCEGLQYAHERGIVHRDLKPSNVIVTRDGLVKILDFGIAKLAEGGTTTVGKILGTPSYMSPEQAQGRRVDRRSDIFSLGAILYELLTGEKAFPGNTPTAILYKILHEEPIPPRVIEPGVEPALEKIVRKALAKDPLARYQACRELQADLKASAKVPAAPRPVPAPVQPKRRTTAAVAALLLWIGVAVLAWREGWVSLEPVFPTPVAQPPSAEKGAAGLPVQARPALEVSSKQKEARGEQPTSGAGKASPRSQAEPRGGSAGAATPSKPRPVEKLQQRRKPAAVPATTAGEKGETSLSKEPGEGAKAPAAVPKSQEPTARKPAKVTTSTQTALSPEQERAVKQWFTLAAQYDARGQYERAAFALKKVLLIDPNNPQAKQLLEEVEKKQELHRGSKPRE